ncbi:hypothetical protein Tco_0974596 [Tanacetum coccineum]|uniref:Uncharacterized protein n=1 Tax=Tanacetum coccineum TaxID=301880 RepID=A0ABQ5EC02_9ASTR
MLPSSSEVELNERDLECDIKLEKVHTDDNLADPFTKALAFPKHSEHTKNIGMLPASSLMQHRFQLGVTHKHLRRHGSNGDGVCSYFKAEQSEDKDMSGYYSLLILSSDLMAALDQRTLDYRYHTDFHSMITKRADEGLINEMSYDPGVLVVLESIFTFYPSIPLNYLFKGFENKVLIIQEMMEMKQELTEDARDLRYLVVLKIQNQAGHHTMNEAKKKFKKMNDRINETRDAMHGLFPRKPIKQSSFAIAMNRIRGKSNSKGGEDPIRWTLLSNVVDGYSLTLPHLKGLQNGDIATSVIKQVKN